jgi:hypothetical protein
MWTKDRRELHFARSHRETPEKKLAVERARAESFGVSALGKKVKKKKKRSAMFFSGL